MARPPSGNEEFFYNVELLAESLFPGPPTICDDVERPTTTANSASRSSISRASLDSTDTADCPVLYLHTVPKCLFDTILQPLDAQTVLSIAGVDEELETRVGQARKNWTLADRVPEGFIIDYEFVAHRYALAMLNNSEVAHQNRDYRDKMPICRRLQDLPLEMLCVIADGLAGADYFEAAKALPRFIYTGRHVGEYGLDRVSVRGITQPDGSKKTVIRVGGRLYEDEMTAWLINNASEVYSVVFDPTIAYFPDGIQLAKFNCECWKLLPVVTNDPIWPGLNEMMKAACRRYLELRGPPTNQAKMCWADVLRNGGATDRGMRGWLLAEIQFGAETVEHLQCLLPFNGSELRIRWQGPATDLQPIWNFIQRAIAMPLANYQEVLVSFWPALPLEELRADVFTGFRMVPSMEGDQWIYTVTDRAQPFELILQSSHLKVWGRI